MDNFILDVLTQIKDTYGDGVFYNPSTVKNILSDLAPGLYKERIQVANFLENNRYFHLKHAERDYPLVRKRLIKEYSETNAVDESMATWVVDIFCSVLGYSDRRQGAFYKKTTEQAPVPEKMNPSEPMAVSALSEGKITLPAPKRNAPCPYVNRIAAGVHSVAVARDGQVLAAGSNEYGQCNTWWWKEIIAVAAGTNYTLGVKKDGRVLAAGYNEYGQCDVQGWSGIKQISAGTRHTVGLRGDGSVVAAGQNENGECNVSKWRHIVHVSAGCRYTFGIKKDGRVIVSSRSGDDTMPVSHLQNVKDVSNPMKGRALALCHEGTVAPIGREAAMGRNFSHWRGLRQISAAPDYFAGLFNNGTVRLLAYFWPDSGIECAPNDWTGIKEIAAGRYHILGVREDGTVAAAMLHPDPGNNKGQCNVGKWNL